MGPDPETSGCEVLQNLEASFTLKLALDTGDTEVLSYCLDLCCPYFKMERFEELADLVAAQEDMIAVFAESPLVKRWLFSLSSAPLILLDENEDRLVRVKEEGEIRLVVTKSKHMEAALREAKKMMVDCDKVFTGRLDPESPLALYALDTL